MRSPFLRPDAFRFAKQAGYWPSVLLGAFVVWQLVFIVAANLLEFYPHRVHQLDELTSYRELPAGTRNPWPIIHALASVTDRWAQLTGQYQMWWLFAPDFPQQATFPVVELRWNDAALELAPITVPSPLEPTDTAAYFHPPTAADRLLHYEANLSLGYAHWNEAAAAADPAHWRKMHFDLVQSQWKSMRAYMRWRMTQFRAEYPDLPSPDEVRLLIRIYPTPGSGISPGDRASPADQPLCRWRCAQDNPPGVLPVEACDRSSGSYVSLPYPQP